MSKDMIGLYPCGPLSKKKSTPHEAEVERTGEVPSDVAAVDQNKRRSILGFMPAYFPRKRWGRRFGILNSALVERELGRGSMALNALLPGGRRISLMAWAKKSDRKRLSQPPPFAAKRWMRWPLTEPDHGSDVRGMKCSA